MGKMKCCFFCVIFCLVLSGPAFSQTIILKSGQKLEARIIEQTDKYVKVDFQEVELVFYADEISSIEQTPSDGTSVMTPQMELLYKAYNSSLNVPSSSGKK
jgi:hypothetical protein